LEQGAGSREQGAGSREQGAGSRELGAGSWGLGTIFQKQGVDPSGWAIIYLTKRRGRAVEKTEIKAASFESLAGRLSSNPVPP
jgi:hypothetical protein